MMERESQRGKQTCCSSKVWMKEECEWDWFGEGGEMVVMRGRERERERASEREREREREKGAKRKWNVEGDREREIYFLFQRSGK